MSVFWLGTVTLEAELSVSCDVNTIARVSNAEPHQDEPQAGCCSTHRDLRRRAPRMQVSEAYRLLRVILAIFWV